MWIYENQESAWDYADIDKTVESFCDYDKNLGKTL